MNSQRLSALALALLTLSGLLIRVYLKTPEVGSIFGAFSYLYQFFTIWTNTLVLIVMSLVFLGRRVHRVTHLATAIAIIGVGLIYHLILSPGREEQFGLDLAANLITHTYVPIFAAVWWLIYMSKELTNWRDTLLPLLFPFIYCLYALLRAEFSNFYPYPFIDLATLGTGRLLINICGISVAFWLMGMALVSCAKLRTKTLQNSTPKS